MAIARALCALEEGSSLLVLDEPTAHLDVRAEAEFFDRFLELTRDVTTILISHRFSTVRRADSICVLEGSRVVECGTHDELMSLGGHYARMYKSLCKLIAGWPGFAAPLQQLPQILRSASVLCPQRRSFFWWWQARQP